VTGIYVILIEMPKATEIKIGKNRKLLFERGFYAYVGSALAGLERRLARHLSTEKKLHWHIDYLLTAARVLRVIESQTNTRKECLIAQALSQRLPSVLGFGCSDCRCASHLFFCHDWKALNNHVLDAFDQNELHPMAVPYSEPQQHY
jgi:Uri superfamily endonuclease